MIKQVGANLRVHGPGMGQMAEKTADRLFLLLRNKKTHRDGPAPPRFRGNRGQMAEKIALRLFFIVAPQSRRLCSAQRVLRSKTRGRSTKNGRVWARQRPNLRRKAQSCAEGGYFYCCAIKKLILMALPLAAKAATGADGRKIALRLFLLLRNKKTHLGGPAPRRCAATGADGQKNSLAAIFYCPFPPRRTAFCSTL